MEYNIVDCLIEVIALHFMIMCLFAVEERNSLNDSKDMQIAEIVTIDDRYMSVMCIEFSVQCKCQNIHKVKHEISLEM